MNDMLFIPNALSASISKYKSRRSNVMLRQHTWLILFVKYSGFLCISFLLQSPFAVLRNE